MSMSPIRRVIMIKNELGIHMRPAELFGRLAQKFEAKIEVARGTHRVDAKSMIDLLTLGAAKGTELVIEAEGRDAQDAVDALANLIEFEFPKEDIQKSDDGKE
jgi:phosphotransferase system HPr (HPr) family protein